MATEIYRVAVIGTRTPDKYQASAARETAQQVSKMGHIVTTGAALGIDTEAMLGATPGKLEVYLPWATYNVRTVPGHAAVIIYDAVRHIDWTASVKRFHPRPHLLSRGAFALHARNYGIVYKAKVVVAFPDERGEGGTGQGIRIARGLGIPVIECRKGYLTSPSMILEVLKAVSDTLPEKTKHGQDKRLPGMWPVSSRPSLPQRSRSLPADPGRMPAALPRGRES